MSRLWHKWAAMPVITSATDGDRVVGVSAYLCFVRCRSSEQYAHAG